MPLIVLALLWELPVIRPFSMKKSCVSCHPYEVDRVRSDEWYELLQTFEDASIYQTWSYGKVRWGERRLSHIVCKQDGEIVGIAQVAVVKPPVFNIGIAYAPWGPLWKRKEASNRIERFQHVIACMKQEYAVRRGLLLRIAPNHFEPEEGPAISVLREAGFERKAVPYRTLRLDLGCSLEDLRKKLDQKWRNQLNRAEKNDLRLVEGTDPELYKKFLFIYHQMMERKKFETGVDVSEFQKIQEDLPDRMKMKIIVCEVDGEPVSALIGSIIGNSGIYLLGATSDEGMKTKGSYLQQWRMIQHLKSAGSTYYDLGGIDPENNPGVFHFKAGLSGKEVSHIGLFEACDNRVSSRAVRVAEKVKSLQKELAKSLSQNDERRYAK